MSTSPRRGRSPRRLRRSGPASDRGCLPLGMTATAISDDDLSLASFLAYASLSAKEMKKSIRDPWPAVLTRRLRWIQRLGMLASLAGGAVGASMVWLAWRVRFHPHDLGHFARTLKYLSGIPGSGWEAYRTCEHWAHFGESLGLVGMALLVIGVAIRPVGSRWFRWLGWLPAAILAGISLSAVAIILFQGLFISRCARHPEIPPGALRFCHSVREHPADIPIKKTEAEWKDAVEYESIVLAGAMGTAGGAAGLSICWLVSVCAGLTEFYRSRRSPKNPKG